MNMIIPNYEILNFDVESLVVSDVGISKVHSQPLLEVLRQLRFSNVISKNELYRMLSEKGLHESDAFEFLERIIPFKSADEIYFEKTIVVHDWEGQADIESLLGEELSGCAEFKGFSDDVVKAVSDVRCFVVFVCHSYDYDQLKKIYFDVARASPKSAVSVCWRMGGFFSIGQPYIADLGSPCHFCIVDRLICNEFVVPAKNKWASVLAFCKNKHVSVPSATLSLYQEMLVIGAVIRKVKYFTECNGERKYQDNILYNSYVQLSDGKIFEESTSHWYMCDCLGADK
ncbi:hypothetical protein PS687_03382 [Pseudomonas fluorescens]|nr:hypothetical protein PS687_03382 [Pseudomonas fluorescens]